MKKLLFFSVCSLCFFHSFHLKAQEIIKVDTVSAVSPVKQTPSEKMRDFVHMEEARVCNELRSFATEYIFKDPAFIEAAKERNTRQVAKAASKYAKILAKEYDADFLFYHPNTRFFVRVNDKSYRGRMRLPADLISSSSACFWERLPSQDVVYSMLIKVDDEKAGFLKISKKLPRMVTNIPDILSEYGKVRVYTALDKTGLKKMAWFKMRHREPNKTKYSGWCTAENLAFLTSIGSGEQYAKKIQKKLLALSDENKDFVYPDLKLSGGVMPLFALNEERLGAIVYTITPFSEDKKIDAQNEQEENEALSEENTENILYRFFD